MTWRQTARFIGERSYSYTADFGSPGLVPPPF
jgi:hypothetical protein